MRSRSAVPWTYPARTKATSTFWKSDLHKLLSAPNKRFACFIVLHRTGTAALRCRSAQAGACTDKASVNAIPQDAERASGIDVTSVNYNFAELLARAKVPR